LQAVLQSTRASVGVGIASSVMGPRVEATYAWPLRYGPRDARRHFQFGMGFSFG
jgi:outer membrane protein assembly factor BamA